jgi:hypothetical protein
MAGVRHEVTTMAVCQQCAREMLTADRCLDWPITLDEVDYDAVPYAPIAVDGLPDSRRCGDCNVVPGAVHHPGCARERCPACDGQLISCGCLDDDDDGDADGQE